MAARIFHHQVEAYNDPAELMTKLFTEDLKLFAARQQRDLATQSAVTHSSHEGANVTLRFFALRPARLV